MALSSFYACCLTLKENSVERMMDDGREYKDESAVADSGSNGGISGPAAFGRLLLCSCRNAPYSCLHFFCQRVYHSLFLL